MTVYMKFFIVMLDQNVNQLGKNELISHSGKISHMIKITNIAI